MKKPNVSLEEAADKLKAWINQMLVQGAAGMTVYRNSVHELLSVVFSPTYDHSRTKVVLVLKTYPFDSTTGTFSYVHV